jgi:protein-S-isoprenylcysteine O-methyltransferase Ste14
MMVQRLRVPLGFVVAAAVLYFAEPTRVSILAGLPVALIGAAFRALAAGVIKKDSALATSGVYALTRNPLYFGSALLGVGFALMSGSTIAAGLISVPFILIYPRVILREEEHLQTLFPNDFRLYRSKVPRFFPRITNRMPRSFAFSQYLANREYNTVLGFAAAVGVLAIKCWVGP